MHPIFAESLYLSQNKDLDTEIQTIHQYIAEKYPVLMHGLGVYANVLHCWGVR